MRFQESVCKARQSLILILTGLIVCGLFIMTSVCLAADDEWTKKANMPTARVDLRTSVVGGMIYAIGGWDGLVKDRVFGTVEAYDPMTDTWVKKADMPTPRFGFSTSVVDGIIYAIGGENHLIGAIFSTVEAYDPSTDTWTEKADMPEARCEFSTSVANGKIYATGGVGWGKNFAAVEEYDPTTDTWTRMADMPTARVFHSTSAVNGKIYAIGGGTDWETALAEGIVEEYTPEGWQPKAISSHGKLTTVWGRVNAVYEIPS